MENDCSRHLPLPKDYVEDHEENYVWYNMDNTCNAQGKRLSDLCKMGGLRIVNGRVGNDKHKGTFTCYTHNGASTGDFILCSPPVLQEIR